MGEALACAHEIPVVHRDFKPDNVIMGADGIVYLVDFGIALPTRPGAPRYTAHGATPGSAGYMAPEQILGHLITPRADLYSFGCVLFELFTGSRPFSPEEGRSLFDLHLNAPVPRHLLYTGSIPVELAELTERLLAKRPQERPSDILAVLDILRSHLPQPGHPGPSPLPDPDPTAAFRFPDSIRPLPPAPEPPVAPAAPRSHRSDEWLSEEEIDAARDEARAELDREGPGTKCERLEELLDDARDQFGPRTELVAEAQLLCADAARIAGDYRRAAELYRRLVDELGRSAVPFMRSVVLQARLGMAECRIPFGEIDAAYSGWEAVVTETAGLVEPPDAVLVRCREVGLELHELGHGAEVDELLRTLDRS